MAILLNLVKCYHKLSFFRAGLLRVRFERVSRFGMFILSNVLNRTIKSTTHINLIWRSLIYLDREFTYQLPRDLLVSI